MSARRPKWSPADFAEQVYDSDLPASARLIAIVLRDEFWRTGRGKVALSTIVDRTGLSKDTVCRHMVRLERAELIKRRVPSRKSSYAMGAMTHYALLVSDGQTWPAPRGTSVMSDGAASVMSDGAAEPVRPSDTPEAQAEGGREQPGSAGASPAVAGPRNWRDLSAWRLEHSRAHHWEPHPFFRHPDHPETCHFCGERLDDDRHALASEPQAEPAETRQESAR